MDFELNDEQQLLRDTTRDLLARAYDPEKRNKVIATDLGWSKDVWSQLAEVGLLGLPFAEDDGGMGAGPVETMAVLVEVGRRLAPEPILDSALLPGSIIADAGTEAQRRELLPRVADGSLLLAFAHAEPGVRWPSSELQTTASMNGAGWTLNGRKNPVLRGDCAGKFIVSAAADGGTGLFLVEADATGVSRRSYETHDGGRAAQLDFADVPAEQLGDVADASAHLAAAIVRGQVALCAEALGAMEESLRLTTEYLKTRKQFGVPLAKFQTLTQRAADMYVSLELARSMMLYATMMLAEGQADATVASRAKLQVGRSARHIGQESIQMHGGIGMTAEYPVGHYVSRLTAIEHTFGDSADHLRQLAANVADYEMVEL
ncbi:acyl-CoA dehydrogenase [Skermania sp. ID1734]|uniref:acyl-CoA dehydrogenase family protein n=1 Tax=Skermania sp. ID1734 TaxID=2597516 RepID=UPI00117E819C|nr:acyl-CoA dehydrogenase family protein [Skermania sp. ID1734]TSE01861.1 acyl-CoA dehydrogenase [Skermania sp. ID1734]